MDWATMRVPVFAGQATFYGARSCSQRGGMRTFKAHPFCFTLFSSTASSASSE